MKIAVEILVLKLNYIRVNASLLHFDFLYSFKFSLNVNLVTTFLSINRNIKSF